MSTSTRTVTDRFSPAVLATAFATFVAFLGIGVVDPVLPIIGDKMGASGAEVELLFTTYLIVMAVAMLVSGVLSARFGNKRVIIVGLAIVVVMATLAGLSNSITELAIVRGGWGFGNALFTSTALAVIVGLAEGGTEEAIMLYEAALGLGIAGGPLLGGYLGSFSWRYPFFGTATLMALALIVSLAFLREPEGKEQATPADMIMALKNPPVLVNALIGLCYSFGFFTILAYSPLTLPDLSATALGVTFFAWGALVAVSSVFVVNWLTSRFDASKVLFADVLGMALVLAAAGFAEGQAELLLPVIVISGIFCGIANAMFTTFAIQVSPFTRSVSSGAYNFLRWSGAAIAPVLAGYLKDAYSPGVPFFVGAVVVFVGAVGLFGGGSFLLNAINRNAAEHVSAD
ncbi:MULTISPECIES: MFS transporter [unclassified Haladaptatus]|uniref:MFS transporter n=1 Tax=unclassified Haladaptatus TaxID=2622732 RepID=UPI00209BBBFD|nr:MULTISPECIES: MFS transporter [unclassified Haladaptatus]MCO8245626.1 MFS transporter [Haladaptatus sp. AB643]MCO8255454.1 MFS transporter [Haladaptatus sp. AB618]